MPPMLISGHRAENEYLARLRDDWRKALNPGHTARLSHKNTRLRKASITRADTLFTEPDLCRSTPMGSRNADIGAMSRFGLRGPATLVYSFSARDQDCLSREILG